MKVLVAIIFIIGSVLARGSGPYLPSGWRPQGPAFFLPSEVAEPAVSPLKDSLQETEASGSEALREYGPPKVDEVFLSTNQGLPDVVTEQAFSVLVKEEKEIAPVEEARKEKAEELTIIIKEEIPTTTESQSVEIETKTLKDAVAEVSDIQSTDSPHVSQVAEEQKEPLVQSEEVKESITPATDVVEEIKTAVEDEAIPLAVHELVPDAVPTAVAEELIDIVQQGAVTTSVFEDTVAPTTAQQEVVQEVAANVAEEDVAPISLAEQDLVQETLPTPLQEVITEVKNENVNNVAEIIVNLENEAKAVGNIKDISSTQESIGGLQQDPARFLVYNPPGFAVYGPPKPEDLARLAAAETVEYSSENNGERKRRLSPKFSSPKNKSK